jgi:thiol:disulfide interchange protein DsbD
MKAVLLSMFLFVVMGVSAQNPVSWTFSSKKLPNGNYEIHMTATLEKGWHIYSQDQPEDAIAMPTTFTITSNPLIEMEGKIKEFGKL